MWPIWCIDQLSDGLKHAATLPDKYDALQEPQGSTRPHDGTHAPEVNRGVDQITGTDGWGTLPTLLTVRIMVT
jgi:hypothetical protein